MLLNQPCGTTHILGKRSHIVGHGHTAHFCLVNDEYVSREHALLAYDDATQRWYVTDLCSKNGTYVNGQRLLGTSVYLKHGDCLVVGNSLFSVQLE